MLASLRQRAFRQGVLGDSAPFFAIWVLLAGFRLIKRIAGDEPKVVYRQELAPGERLTITHTDIEYGETR